MPPTAPVTPTTPTPQKVAEPIVVPFAWNQAIIDKKIQDVKENLGNYEGKPGYNPFIYMSKEVNPLLARMEGGETTKELNDAILSLKSNYVPEAPGNTAKENRDKGCKEPQSSGVSHALGQHVGAGYLQK